MREKGTVLEATYAYIYVKCLAKYWKLTGLKQEWIWSSHFSDMIVINPHNDLLPIGLTAQLGEHWTGIAEVRVRIPVQAFLAAA